MPITQDTSQPKKPYRILVRMPNWLGDLVMATPILKDLRSYFPDSYITAMCQISGSSLLKENPYINEIFTFKKPEGPHRRQQKREIIRNIRLGEYDAGILLTNSFSSAWWFWQARIPQRIGYSMHYRRFLLTKPIPLPSQIETQHLVNTYKNLLQSIGIPFSNSYPEIFLKEEEIEKARRTLASNGISSHHVLIGINPTAAYGPAKCWLPERFKQLSEKLIAYHPDIRIVFFGDLQGKPLVKGICENFSSKQILDLSGKTEMREFIALIKLCDAFLTNDSGPMHVADAIGTPLVALFGSTNDTKTGPYRMGKVIHKRVECSPCYLRECPIDFKCMRKIEVDEVYQEIMKMLKHKIV